MTNSLQGRFLAFFADRHILANMILIGVLLGGYLCWTLIGKEEMPEFVHDRVSVSVSYPGATAEEVEHHVVKPLEDAFRGLEGVDEIRSTASQGTGSVSLTLDFDHSDYRETVAEIRNLAAEVSLPDDITEDPRVRQYKSSTKAIIDLVVYDESVHLLDDARRRELQAVARALENRLLALPEVHSVERDGFRREELQIRADPRALRRVNIPMAAVASEIRAHNQRRPAGTLKDAEESKVTVAAQLDSAAAIEGLIVQGGFEGPVVRLGDVAAAAYAFEDVRSLLKVNGHEAVILNVVKRSDAGIVKAVEAVKAEAERFRRELRVGDSSIALAVLDDESRGVRGRLSLIASNGSLGMALILVLLLVFLNLRSAIWVALGIPFCFGFTLIGAYALGYTVNNMTLAAVIIVMGMVVDDAIVVAENVTRLRSRGLDARRASVEGARFVGLPITAAVVTTCAAFLPLLFFDDRFGQLIRVLPVIITLMLAASLVESLLILPGHMRLGLPFRRARQARHNTAPPENGRAHWFERVEDVYGAVLRGVLRAPWAVFAVFIALLVWVAHVYRTDMKFVLFPNEETTSVRIELEAPEGTGRTEMAERTRGLEDILAEYLEPGREMVGFRTQIARSRWGRSVQENVAVVWAEIVPREQREKSTQDLIAEWKARTDTISALTKIEYRTARFGSESGNALAIQVLENRDPVRRRLADSLAARLMRDPAVSHVEMDRPPRSPEYRVSLRRDVLRRLSIDPAGVATTLRTLLEGTTLYEIPADDEPIPVILTTGDAFKRDIGSVLSLPVENRGGYLVTLSDVVDVERTTTPATIERERHRRVTTVYADIVPESGKTPLEVAEAVERDVFPALSAMSPSSILRFTGEVEDTRRSRSNFGLSIIAVILLIYALLALLFNSLLKPFAIMLSIPFGVVGVVLAFHFHGMDTYGFFGLVGVLGLMGVVINDSIVMMVKLQERADLPDSFAGIRRAVADASKTRLRAVLLTTLTTVAGLFPTAYGILGYDAMLAEMMLAMGWGLLFGSLITLLLVPSLYASGLGVRLWVARVFGKEGARA